MEWKEGRVGRRGRRIRYLSNEDLLSTAVRQCSMAEKERGRETHSKSRERGIHDQIDMEGKHLDSSSYGNGLSLRESKVAQLVCDIYILHWSGWVRLISKSRMVRERGQVAVVGQPHVSPWGNCEGGWGRGKPRPRKLMASEGARWLVRTKTA